MDTQNNTEAKKIAKVIQRLNIIKPNKVRRYKDDNTPGRNDTCPCGSGKKSKSCCGAVAQQSMITAESIRYLKKKSKYLIKKQKAQAELIIETTEHKCKNCRYIENGACCNGAVNEKPALIDEVNNCIEFGLPEIPNKTTVDAVNELENGGGHKTKNLDELFADLEREDGKQVET